MTIWNIGLALLLSYLIGAFPSGWFVVKIASGKDVRRVESGRTGGTNAMRAAGFLAGLFTAALDVFKGFSTGWIVHWLTPGNTWVLVAAPLVAILGHNYSVFLIERGSHGKLQLRGGAGGAPCLGGAIAVGGPAMLLILPLAALVFVLIGYASVTTISIAVLAMLISIVQAVFFGGSWLHVLYGLIAIGLVMWSLRPNLKRLRDGNERVVGLRAYFRKRAAEKRAANSQDSHPGER
ncbi:acyl-phosphate glycerol-3-phosphate acyltransferase [Longilinea arvoryzae]|uniref:Glycerol-3-phosphate acyltransferase n=1 Tax=Longilinea arvoryzae TaxID=360412 RepID=A0A0S7BF39_9CHLR|nr:glycerol-3-phosphate acyltransferase [Longilinea arvoryzae]GAP14105.1 acyl-phosphate glycerol-3-phosphate acyltransferase [Longilinea arvoryzae]